MKFYIKTFSEMGFSWVTFRLCYELRRKTGLLKKKFPPGILKDNELLERISGSFNTPNDFINWWRQNKAQFFFAGENLPSNLLINLRKGSRICIDLAENALNKNFQYFSRWYVKKKDFDWHLNPVTSKRANPDLHWSRGDDLSSELGDIKFIWEMSRFRFVFDYIRAFAVTGEEKFAEAFWEAVEDWEIKNPVELGVNWRCSQELAFRAMAWICGLYAFMHTNAATNIRIWSLLRQLYHHTIHIDKNFDFALKSVRNNHVISEAAGLFTMGILFPFFKESGKWKTKGKKYLELEGLRQIYSDGAYLQHSFNYQRLVLQVYTWCLTLGKLHSEDFSDTLKERLLKCAMFLYQHQDEKTGMVPNYGMNDGTLVFPWTDCNYLDYRPQLNTIHYLLTGNRLYDDSLCNEDLFWFCGAKVLDSTVSPTQNKKTKAFPVGGYYVLRNNNTFGMVRCGTYRDRPSQADMLHFDLWWKGLNILCDAGTFSYNTEKKWLDYFNGTKSHNTIMIDNQDQMLKGPRFMWLNWTKGRTITFDSTDYIRIFEGEHYSYKKLVHRRGIVNVESSWIVIDDIFGEFTKSHVVSQSWLTIADSYNIAQEGEIILDTKEGKYVILLVGEKVRPEIYYGDLDKALGWQSLYYGEKTPAYQIVRRKFIKDRVRLITALFPLNSIKFSVTGNKIYLDKFLFELDEIGATTIFKTRTLKEDNI